MQSAIDLIIAERERQIAKGYDSAHDDTHKYCELAVTAGKLALGQNDLWGISEKHKDNRIGELTIAAALLVAEIERLQRIELAKEQK